MAKNYYLKLQNSIKSKVLINKEKLDTEDEFLQDLFDNLHDYIWDCFADLAENEFTPTMARFFADNSKLEMENVRKLISCKLDYMGYLAEKQRTDEIFRKFEMGDYYGEYQQQLKSKQDEEKTESERNQPPPFLLDPQGNWKKTIIDFLNAIKIHKGICENVKSGPPTPIPIWPKTTKVYPAKSPTVPNKLTCTWKPVNPIQSCKIVYNIQIQPLAPNQTGWYPVHKKGPYIALGLTKTNYVLDSFAGLKGRWRVWAKDGNGRTSEKSDWQYFFFPIKAIIIEPTFSFTFTPKSAKRGEAVQIIMSQRKDVMVYFKGQPLPKRTQPGGKIIIVTVPGNATSGYFELEFDGNRYRSSEKLIVL